MFIFCCNTFVRQLVLHRELQSGFHLVLGTRLLLCCVFSFLGGCTSWAPLAANAYAALQMGVHVRQGNCCGCCCTNVSESQGVVYDVYYLILECNVNMS